jgi:hypothetical protein
MPPFHFKPGKEQELTWFHDSPSIGDPKCICSYCKELITEEDEVPIRMWGEHSGIELRLHMYCARLVIVELSPKIEVPAPPEKPVSRYKFDPAYAEGKYAFAEGERRGSNPYSATGSQRSCYAWWDGWDAAWEESHPHAAPSSGSRST